MTNTPLDPIAQLVAKYQSNGHQPAQQSPASQPQQKKSWTGFAEKTLWDWLNLLGVLLIPLILGAGTIIVTAQQSAISQRQHESDLSIANNQFQEALLKTFRDDISRLVFDQHLLTAKSGDSVQILAQSYTNDAFRKLDLPRKVLLVQFLHDLHLVVLDSENSPLILLNGLDLNGADLNWADLGSTNLYGVSLYKANMHAANLGGDNLKRAILEEAYLYETNLDGANLYKVFLNGAVLDKANLHKTNLMEANLSGASLYEADLSEADLSGAKVTPTQLAKAKYLKDATLPDGSRYPSSSYPIPNHDEPPS